MTPDEYTIQETLLKVGDDHSLYFQEWGSKQAKLPIVFLHGGPGGGCKDRHKQSFDQRGSGKSLPYGSLKHNTTQDLVEDIEKIADYLRLEQFVLTGVSWGSCLALAYALQYPKRVRAMVLGGIFTGSGIEIDWLDNGGWRDFFPESWEQYLENTPKIHRDSPSLYHYNRALGSNAASAKRSAYEHNNLEASILSLDDRFVPEKYEDFDPTATLIEMHYLANRCFLPDRYILGNANKLNMSIWLVQGRYDFVCPPGTAYALQQRLPNSHLIWSVSGHRTEHENWNIMRTITLQITEEN